MECLRTLDRLRLAQGLTDVEIASRRETVSRLLKAIEVVELTKPILSRALQSLPTTLGTLDTIRLATALLWKERMGVDLIMATQDEGLATAPHARGLRVISSFASV